MIYIHNIHQTVQNMYTGGFLYLTQLVGDKYIDKIAGFMNKTSNIVCKTLHGACHGICVGLGFVL